MAIQVSMKSVNAKNTRIASFSICEYAFSALVDYVCDTKPIGCFILSEVP